MESWKEKKLEPALRNAENINEITNKYDKWKRQQKTNMVYKWNGQERGC